MAHLADDSSCAAGSCLDAEDHAAAQPFSETEQQLRMELLALQEQHQLQQQEVALLHAQVERLSMLQMDRSSDEGHVSVGDAATIVCRRTTIIVCPEPLYSSKLS